MIPSNITMLSVEQEVEGDDTAVLDSVLASDVRRQNLLNREKELQDAINRFAVCRRSSAEHSSL